MKVISAILLSMFALSASAQGIDCRSGVDHKHPACYGMQYAGHNHGYRTQHRHPHVVHRGNDWVAPVIGAVVLGAVIHEATRPRVIEQPVIVEQYPVQTVCTEWREVLLPDGRIQRERTCYQR